LFAREKAPGAVYIYKYDRNLLQVSSLRAVGKLLFRMFPVGIFDMWLLSGRLLRLKMFYLFWFLSIFSFSKLARQRLRISRIISYETVLAAEN
jgi:hypothetical protein